MNNENSWQIVFYSDLCVCFTYSRIMMLTVIKNTKNAVKFWFLKNFLSPSLTVFYSFIFFFCCRLFEMYEVCHTVLFFFFVKWNMQFYHMRCHSLPQLTLLSFSKAFLPHMAQKYGFDYELVQYHWPHWLHAQTEKQRTIWGWVNRNPLSYQHLYSTLVLLYYKFMS